MKQAVLILLLCILLVLPISLATPQDISILEVQYNNGDMHIINRTYDFGYVPDRVLMPKEGYNLSIYGDDEMLYSFLFLPPTKEYLDGRAGGGFFERRYFTFPLVIPNYAQEEMIQIRNGENIVATYGESFSKKTYWFFLVILGIVILTLLVLLRKNLFPKDRLPS